MGWRVSETGGTSPGSKDELRTGLALPVEKVKISLGGYKVNKWSFFFFCWIVDEK